MTKRAYERRHVVRSVPNGLGCRGTHRRICSLDGLLHAREQASSIPCAEQQRDPGNESRRLLTIYKLAKIRRSRRVTSYSCPVPPNNWAMRGGQNPLLLVIPRLWRPPQRLVQPAAYLRRRCGRPSPSSSTCLSSPDHPPFSQTTHNHIHRLQGSCLEKPRWLLTSLQGQHRRSHEVGGGEVLAAFQSTGGGHDEGIPVSQSRPFHAREEEAS